MNAVGKLGSFLSAPFHPFGGAVDIIVVEQQDGSFKSSPWYVRFGKFQGVLKSKEKVVSINVNGVDANFNMYLDYKGEAYFLREEEVEEGDLFFSPSSSGNDTDGKLQNRRPMKSKSLNYDSNYPNSVTQIDVGNGNVITRTNSKRSRILRYVFGRKSVKENSFSEGENISGVVRAESLERAEIAADLLEVKWSTNLNSNKCEKDNFFPSSDEEALKDGSIKDLKKHDGQRYEDASMNQNVADNSHGNKTHDEACSLSFQKLENSAQKTSEEISCLVAEYLVETVTLCGNINKCVSDESIQIEKSGVASADNIENAENMVSDIGSLELEPCDENMLKREHFNEEFLVETNHIVINGNKRLESESSSNRFHERVESLSVPTISRGNDILSEVREDISVTKEVDDIQKPSGGSALLNILGSEISEEEQLLFGNLDEFTLGEVKDLELVSRKVEEVVLSLSTRDNEGDESSDNPHLEDRKSDATDGRRKSKTTSREIHIGINDKVQPKEATLRVRSLPNIRSLDNRISNNLGHSLDSSRDSSSDWSRTLLLSPDFISCVETSADNDGQSTLAQQTNQDSKTIYELEDRQINPHGDDSSASTDAYNGGSTKVSEPALNSNGSSETDDILKSPSGKNERTNAPKVNVVTKKIITLTPTSEQLATLNLKEGRNIVKFTFSTSMLGKQQVDARIYLWRWDTRIVISDVDGTITKSDVLGQFMPMVGVDWSHSGVAHLFSAIKENGYQLIFLSARAVSQAYLTKQFLFNLKQDGKTLPDGPVVISPDGLFPSLFREVVRRAPHEFKIACLEEIKSLFPSDWNPFYAGFGNRDTDEFSYLKVGIPKGKIFIINTKGEIVVNHQIATKSYPSLHDLVNAMFPPTLLFEEEKFNSWNFWKLPPLAIKP